MAAFIHPVRSSSFNIQQFQAFGDPFRRTTVPGEPISDNLRPKAWELASNYVVQIDQKDRGPNRPQLAIIISNTQESPTSLLLLRWVSEFIAPLFTPRLSRRGDISAKSKKLTHAQKQTSILIKGWELLLWVLQKHDGDRSWLAGARRCVDDGKACWGQLYDTHVHPGKDAKQMTSQNPLTGSL